MPNIILFDIDYTLINSHLMKINFKKSLLKCLEVSEKSFDDTSKRYIKSPSGFTDFNPYEYLNYLADKYDKKAEDLAKIYFDNSNFSNVLYPDVRKVLERLSKDNNLGIFSEGFEDFQILKLHKTEILSYFKPDLTFIYRRKLTEKSINYLPESSLIVDDNIYVLEALDEVKKFKTAWINRKSLEQNERIKTISNLSQLEGYLRDLKKVG